MKLKRVTLIFLAVLVVATVFAQWRRTAFAEDLGARGPSDDSFEVNELLDEVDRPTANAQGAASGPGVPASLELENPESVDELQKMLDADPVSGEAVGQEPVGSSSGSEPVTSDLDSLESELEKAIDGASPAASSAARGEAKTGNASMPEDPIGPPEFQESVSNGDPAVRNAITNLEFKSEPGLVRILVSAENKLAYKRITAGVSQQHVYVFENTTVPEKLQRAYDTSEFPGSVALFTLLQIPNSSPPASKLIVQLRQEQAATVVPGDRGLTIDYPIIDLPNLDIVNQRTDDLLSNDNIYASNQKYRGEAIKRLEIKDAQIQDVLRLIAKHSGYSIVVGDDVTGRIGTLSLENVPWDQAFTLLLQSKRLGYVKDGKILRVATLGALRSEREEAASMDAARKRVDPLKTVLMPVSFAQVGDLAQRLRPFLGDRGTLDSDPRSNTMIVRDISSNVERIQKLITSLDTPPATVSVTAKLVEVSDNFTKRMGISHLSFSSLLGGLNVSQALNLSAGGSSVTNVTIPSAANLDARLQLAELNKQGRILASPSVSVLNNQNASVRQSISFFVPAGDAAAGGQLVAAPQARQVTASLMLNVVPVVSGDGTIFMTVRLSNETPVIQGVDTTIDQREVTTQVLLENGDTAVIAGVFSNTVNISNEGVPFLMHIPILGNFFKGQSESDVRGEILVFLTARVTNAEQSLKRSF